MGFLNSIKSSVTSAVNTATRTVSAQASAAAGTLSAMKKVVIATTKKAVDTTTSAVYTAAKTVKKYAVVPYEVAHKAASSLTKLGEATGRIAKAAGHKALHAAHHAGHALHTGVGKTGALIQKATIATLQKVTPVVMHSKIASVGVKFLKASILAPVLSGIKTAYKTSEAIKASLDPKVSSEDAKKLWIKAGVSAAETALNAVTRLSPYGLAFAVADVATELSTGKDIGGHIAAAVIGGSDKH